MAAETVNCQDEAGPKMLDFCLNYVSTHENCVAYLFEHGLLRTQSVCDNCGLCMSLVKKTQKNDTSDGFLWRCKDCISTHSIRNDSVFAVCSLFHFSCLHHTGSLQQIDISKHSITLSYSARSN